MATPARYVNEASDTISPKRNIPLAGEGERNGVGIDVSVLFHPILNLQTMYTLKVVGVTSHDNEVLMQCVNF